MTYKDLIEELSEYGLSITNRLDGTYSIGSKMFANPLIIFNPTEQYQGSVIVKSINSTLFSRKQIATALHLIDEFLDTPHDEMEPVKYDEIYSGMRLWDNENKRWQKVLRVYLWEDIIKENPSKFYAKKPKQ